MDFNYTLKFRTFDSLVEDVRVDFRSFTQEGLIEPQDLIKVALRVSYDLGLRITMIRQKVISIEKGKGRLPDDFNVMNYALLCGEFTVSRILPQGTHIEDVPKPFNQNTPCDPLIPVYKNPIEPNACTDPIPNECCPTELPNTTTPLCLTRCGQGFQLVQKIAHETRTYRTMHPVRFINTNHIDQECPNKHWNHCRDTAFIKDGFVWLNLQCANFYMSYMGALEDDNGNILVPDHPYLNEYYEYALKERILENLAMQGVDVTKQLAIVVPKLRASRNNSLTVVNMPNFNEMQHLWETNRKAMYGKYYDQFKSFGNYGGFVHNNLP